jgi:hypothetical protein
MYGELKGLLAQTLHPNGRRMAPFEACTSAMGSAIATALSVRANADQTLVENTQGNPRLGAETLEAAFSPTAAGKIMKMADFQDSGSIGGDYDSYGQMFVREFEAPVAKARRFPTSAATPAPCGVAGVGNANAAGTGMRQAQWGSPTRRHTRGEDALQLEATLRLYSQKVVCMSLHLISITAPLATTEQSAPPSPRHTPHQTHASIQLGSDATPDAGAPCVGHPGLHQGAGIEPTRVPSCEHAAPHHHLATAHLGYYWERRLLELGGSAL